MARVPSIPRKSLDPLEAILGPTPVVRPAAGEAEQRAILADIGRQMDELRANEGKNERTAD